MSKLACIDKDKTVICSANGAPFINNTSTNQAVIPGVPEALERLEAEGYILVLISNQGGVKNGHKSLENAILEFRIALELLPQFEYAYFCPNDGQTCIRVCPVEREYWGRGAGVAQYGTALEVWYGTYRKPQAGMIHLAQWEQEVAEKTIREILVIGDRTEDQGAADAARAERAAGGQVLFQWAHEWRGDEPIL